MVYRESKTAGSRGGPGMKHFIRALSLGSLLLVLAGSAPGADDLSRLRTQMEAQKRAGDYDSALTTAHQLANAAHTEKGPTSRDYADALNELAAIEMLRDPRAAVADFKTIIGILKKNGEPKARIDRINLARIQQNLGLALLSGGDLNAAKIQLEKVLEVQTELLGRREPDTAQTVHSLGLALFMRGERAEAKKRFDEALSIRVEKLGERAVQTALRSEE